MNRITRGLQIPGDVSLPEKPNFDVTARTELAVVTLDSLGLVTDKGEATESIGEAMQSLNDFLAVNQPTSAVEPYPAIELSDRFGLMSLIREFDEKQRYETEVCQELWQQYSPAELNRRQIGAVAVTGPNRGVTASTRAMLLGGNNVFDEAGLYYTAKDLKYQIKQVGSQGLVNPADYIILSAQRREAGEAPLDQLTATRFPQLDMKVTEGTRHCPSAESEYGQLRLRESGGLAYRGAGVRLSVGQESA